ncbi:MAG TPA: hypothetical protein VGN27_05695 [Gaiellaceae bacterium]|nr:hypothetical protein [Gaiellaceae bacterium]
MLDWLDPLKGNGYQFWSGIGSGSPILAAGLVWWHHHNCHVQRCWRLSWHPHPDHGHPVCRRHHPDGDSSQVRRPAAHGGAESQAH